MTPAGLAQLARDEGCRLRAYPDDGGVWTIGYGCTGATIGPGLVWSQAEADAELAARVAQTEAGLARAWAALDGLGPVRRDVLVNIAFNIGVEGLMRWPLTLAAAGAGRFAQAADDIAGNGVWSRQVGARAERCAQAMRTGAWGVAETSDAYGAAASRAATEG